MKATGIIVLILVILQQQFLQKYGGAALLQDYKIPDQNQ